MTFSSHFLLYFSFFNRPAKGSRVGKKKGDKKKPAITETSEEEVEEIKNAPTVASDDQLFLHFFLLLPPVQFLNFLITSCCT
jgi:hypothetical protein